MPGAPTCPRCAGAMAAGFMPDVGYGSVTVGKWVAGLPEKNFWTGLKMRGRQQHDVVTYRCGRCGLLESYAH